AIATAEQPDAILLDVMMPRLDGKAVLKLLQAQAETQDIPVIFLTAQARTSEQEALRDLGVAGIVTKPFSPNTIATHIKTILGWSD
ncbi:MAG: response regulator, partial [Phormidesmis sp.]